ncbi:MAG: TonB-dependent receptor [Chitinophagaceae bacterium]|nr:TonB-dependent receptor [Chitinophagaceae bacterium]
MGILLCVVVWGKVYAQPCNIQLTVVVKDDHSLEPLAYASIVFNNKSYVGGADGKIQIRDLCKGKIDLAVSHTGCQTQYLSLQLKANTVTEVYMHHVKVELGEVSVLGLRKNELQVKQELKGQQLFATRGQNLAQSLTAINGVRMLATGGSIAKPVINGLHSNRLLIATNGVKIESQQWGSDHAPELDPYAYDKFTVINAYDKFTVIKGAASVRYGAEAMGGVVLAEPKPLPKIKTLQGELNAAAFSNNGMGALSAMAEGANGKKNNWAWRLQGSLRKAANLRTPGYWLDNTAFTEGNFAAATGLKFNQWDVEASLNYFGSTIGLYTGAHVDNLDDLNRAIASDKPLFPGKFSYQTGRPRQQVQHWIGKVNARVMWNEKQQTTFWVAHQENIRKEFDSRSFIPFPELALNMGTTSAEAVHSIELPTGGLWQSGLQASHQQNVNQPTSARIFIRNFESWNAGLFSTIKFNRDKWTYEAGLRYDYKFFESFYRNNGQLIVHNRNFSNVTATVGARYRIGNNLEVISNVATAWRPPAPNELYANGLHQGLAAVEVGNQDFKAEKSVNANLQLEYKLDSTLQVEIGFYHHNIRDFIYLQPVTPPALTINGYYPRFEYRQTNAALTGLDASVSVALVPRLLAFAKINLLYARNLTQNEWIIMMPANRYETGLHWHIKTGPRWVKPYAKVWVAYTSLQTRVPIDKNTGQVADYAPPPAAYTLLNAEGGAILTPSNIEVGLAVYNMGNTAYRDYLNRFRYFVNEAGTNIALRIKIPVVFQHK